MFDEDFTDPDDDTDDDSVQGLDDSFVSDISPDGTDHIPEPELPQDFESPPVVPSTDDLWGEDSELDAWLGDAESGALDVEALAGTRPESALDDAIGGVLGDLPPSLDGEAKIDSLVEQAISEAEERDPSDSDQ
jgi:hypothetical protein